MRICSKRPAALALLGLCTLAIAQEKPEDVRIVAPVVDKAAGTVTLPGAFWNEHVAEWVEVALSGRPSDFLHETIISTTTTRALLEQALRDIGCRDGDAWVDGIKDFVRIRGDRFIVLVSLEREGKKESYSLDELLSFSRWGVAMGPYGFMFKGDPDRDKPKAAVIPVGAAGVGTDGTKILRDDPQMALVFKGLQNRSQSFADHPLAYVEDRWEWEEIDRNRNRAVLPAAVFDSNGKVALTLTFERVTEEQLLTESAKVWHDEAFKAYMLQHMDTAKLIDKEKAEYWALRQNKGPNAVAEGRMAVLAAELERDYAILDGAWSQWAVEHLKPETEDVRDAAALRQQASLWGQFMALNQERATQLAIAAETPGNPQAGPALVARSRALVAENKMSRDYWQKQWDRVRAEGEPKAEDVWAQSIRLHLALVEARLSVGAAGVAYGTAQQANPREPTQEADLKKEFEAAVTGMALADARLSLANVEFEISKRADMPEDAELPELRKQREALAAKVKELGGGE